MSNPELPQDAVKAAPFGNRLPSPNAAIGTVRAFPQTKRFQPGLSFPGCVMPVRARTGLISRVIRFFVGRFASPASSELKASTRLRLAIEWSAIRIYNTGTRGWGWG